jgi:hypothetical protein
LATIAGDFVSSLVKLLSVTGSLLCSPSDSNVVH